MSAVAVNPLFPKPITADGATATPEQMARAWSSWVAGSLMTATTLESALIRAGVVGTARYWPAARVADRMLQRARKAGVIHFVKGGWELVE